MAARSLIPSWDNGLVNVYVDKNKVFSLEDGFFDGPIFIYPFAGNRKFLCDYNYDTAILVFVVGLDAVGTNSSESQWPSNGELRSFLRRSATNVVLRTKGMVRLPTYGELRDVSDYLSRATTSQIRADSIPYCDFGIYRTYVSKDYLLLDLATNRQSYWPL